MVSLHSKTIQPECRWERDGNQPTGKTVVRSEMIVFWVSIDREDNGAVVHRCSCVYVEGREGDTVGLEWHGPYDTVSRAMNEALEQGVRVVRNCHLCRNL